MKSEFEVATSRLIFAKITHLLPDLASIVASYAAITETEYLDFLLTRSTLSLTIPRSPECDSTYHFHEVTLEMSLDAERLHATIVLRCVAEDQESETLREAKVPVARILDALNTQFDPLSLCGCRGSIQQAVQKFLKTALNQNVLDQNVLDQNVLDQNV